MHSLARKSITTHSDVADTSIKTAGLRQKNTKNIKFYNINQTQPSHLPQGISTYPITMTPCKHTCTPPLHKLGNANTVAKYHENYQTLIKNGTANGDASNAYLTASYVPAKIKCIIMKYRTGTLYNQKHAAWLKHSISMTCPLCPQLDSALHILSGCQHTQIRIMITERRNLACSMIFKAISKTGSLGSCFVCMDIGSSERLAMQYSRN